MGSSLKAERRWWARERGSEFPWGRKQKHEKKGGREKSSRKGKGEPGKKNHLTGEKVIPKSQDHHISPIGN